MQQTRQIAFVLFMLSAARLCANTNARPSALQFPVGESIEFTSSWGMVPVARTVISSSWTNRNDRQLISIRYHTSTYSVFYPVYAMEDDAETLTNPVTLLPEVFHMRVRRRWGETWITDATFDYTNGICHHVYRNRHSGFLKVQELPINSDTRDLLSFLYHIRGRLPEPGNTNSYTVVADEGFLNMRINYSGPETITVGRFPETECLVVTPHANFKGLIIDEGKVRMWVTRDPRCVALRLIVDAPLANVYVDLTKVEGPGTDVWVRAAGALPEP
ncbi:MAG: DUF3108 domain-containing protein [bacterium]